jgi:sec-independent protein translocase protein TatA
MGIGIWELLVLFLIVLLLFGTKRLRNIGNDLGSAIKGFRSAMNDGDSSTDKSGADAFADSKNIDGETVAEKKKSSETFN